MGLAIRQAIDEKQGKRKISRTRHRLRNQFELAEGGTSKDVTGAFPNP